MKRGKLEKHLRRHGCVASGGSKHEHWMNPVTLAMTTVPRHDEIKFGTVKSICRALDIPRPLGR